MFCVVKLKSIIIAFCLLIVAIILSFSFSGTSASAASVYFGANQRLVPVYSVECSDNRVALSFDAAWGSDKTKDIMDICDEYNVKATFFLTGFWVEENKELVKEIFDRGFEIANHSNTHADFTKLSCDSIKLEVEATNNKIFDITGQNTKFFRCPYGAYNNNVINTLQNCGYVPVQWSIDTLDWKGTSASQIVSKVLNNVKSGSIILCHNNSDHIVDALPMMLDRLIANKYKVGKVGDIVLQKDYEISSLGIQSAA